MGSKAGDVAKEQVKNQSKKAAEKAIKKAGKKAAAKGAASAASSGAASAAGITSLGAFFATPVGWVVLAIIAIILILILVIGFIGFFETMPGLMMEKITDFYEKALGSLYCDPTEDPKVEVSDEAELELANYIRDLGYDVVGYGFLSDVKIDEDTNQIKEVVNGRQDYLYAYILQNERTYSMTNYNNTTWNEVKKFIKELFVPGFWFKEINEAFLPDDPHEKAKEGMIDVDGWSNGGSEIFDAMYIERDKDSGKTRLKVERWHVKDDVQWWNPFTWGGIFNVDTFSWDMDGWTPRYGKPIELSLALHLSTMAPDFAYDFCMDDDLQASVKLKTRAITYNASYKYETKKINPETGCGYELTQSEIDEVYNKIIDDIATMSYENQSDVAGNKLYEIENQGPLLPTKIFWDVSVINIAPVRGSVIWSKHFKMIDSDGNVIRVYDSSGNNVFDGNYRLSTDDSESADIYWFADHQDDIYIIRGGPIEYHTAGIRDNAGLYHDLIIKCLSLTDLIDLLNKPSLDDDDSRLIVSSLYDLYNHAGRTIDAYIDGIQDRKSTYKRDELNDTYSQLLYWTSYNFENGNATQTETRNKLIEIQNGITSDYETALAEYIEDVKNRNEQLIEWGISFTTLEALHNTFDKSPGSLATYQPYISYVRNHWYKDVLFEPEEYRKAMGGESNVSDELNTAIREMIDSNYQIYEYKNKDTIVMPFEPTGDEDDPNAQAIGDAKEEGTMYAVLTPQGTQVTQINQPITTSNEKHHWKVKNWLKNGYFFIFDGNPETASANRLARRYLSEDLGVYEPEDPLLGVDGGSSTIDTKAIDDRARELNRILREDFPNAYPDRRVKKIPQLKKITFEKDSSLTAFSILEGVHTRDAEYVYRDLKELMIELDYFTRSDFASIEMGPLKWLIPEYRPQEWPMKKFEKDDNSYETQILCKESVTELKKWLGEEDKEFDPTQTTEEKSKTNKVTSDGFTEGSQVVAPGKCKVIKIEDAKPRTTKISVKNGNDDKEIELKDPESCGQAVTVKFTATGTTRNFTLKIEGIQLAEGIKKGDTLDTEELIGYTIPGVNIKLLLKDRIKAVVNNIEDYISPKNRKIGLNVDYGKLFFIPYEGGSLNTLGPESMGRPNSDEIAFGICQWTLKYSTKGDYLTAFLKGMVEIDPSFCRELKAFIGLSFDELWEKTEEIHKALEKMAKRDKQYLIELEMTYALNTITKYAEDKGESAAWILDRSDPVIGTYFSALNWRPADDWISDAGINKNMSDEEIIKRLCKAFIDKDSSKKGRCESQAKLAIDMLNNNNISAKKFCEEGFATYPDYAQGRNSGYLNGVNTKK